MGQRSVEILIVEDNEADVFLTYTALRDAKITNTISVVTDEQVAAYIVKPASHEEYFTAIRAVKELWFHIVALPAKHAESGT